MSEIFDKQNNVYNFRNTFEFATRNVRTIFNGTEIISILGRKTWDIVPSEIKTLETVNAFKKEIKKWKPENCPCRLCITCINNFGFLQT